MKHYPQINYYFCGPASGKMILKNINAGRSAYNNAPQDQNHIGGAAHMRTWQNKETSWDKTGRFRIGLNRWHLGQDNGFYVRLDSPTPAQFKEALLVTVQAYGRPFAADTVEWAYGNHYNGHPKSREIGHWIVISAFKKYGNVTRFSDPSTSVYPNAKAQFNSTTKSFVNTYLQQNGIVW